MRERFNLYWLFLKESLKKSENWEFLATTCLRFLVMVGMVYLWNWLFSAELNKFLFGSVELQMIKGVTLFTVIDITIGLFKDQTN